MTTTITLAALAEPASFPWELIGGGGAAIAVIAAVAIMQRAHSETLKAVTASFSATVQDATAKNQQNVEAFSKTAADLSEVNATLVREARASHEKCEETVHQILKDHLIVRPSRRTDPH